MAALHGAATPCALPESTVSLGSIDFLSPEKSAVDLLDGRTHLPVECNLGGERSGGGEWRWRQIPGVECLAPPSKMP
jgi:hypothetical protein